jgi:hypothetical protein
MIQDPAFAEEQTRHGKRIDREDLFDAQTDTDSVMQCNLQMHRT